MKNTDQIRCKLIKDVLNISLSAGLGIPALAQSGSRQGLTWQQLKIGPQTRSFLNSITSMHKKIKNISGPGPFRYSAVARTNDDPCPVKLTDPGRQDTCRQDTRRRTSAGIGHAGKQFPCLVQD